MGLWQPGACPAKMHAEEKYEKESHRVDLKVLPDLYKETGQILETVNKLGQISHYIK